MSFFLDVIIGRKRVNLDTPQLVPCPKPDPEELSARERTDFDYGFCDPKLIESILYHVTSSGEVKARISLLSGRIIFMNCDVKHFKDFIIKCKGTWVYDLMIYEVSNQLDKFIGDDVTIKS